ncbi:MAG: ribbon-helix-helix protein, CopG family, partial [Gemmatimonadetes bacterium]|nr:ribbon-helix-helix protein, CopG family [Gemmatimonadota bacterium]
MNRETTLRIKLDREMDAQLERLAQSRRKSKGQL